jgi:hypothetical protein
MANNAGAEWWGAEQGSQVAEMMAPVFSLSVGGLTRIDGAPQHNRLFHTVWSSTRAADAEFQRNTRGREHNMSVQLDLVRLGGWIGGSHCRRQQLLEQAVRSGGQIGGRAGQSQDRRPSSPGEVLPIQYPAANQF